MKAGIGYDTHEQAIAALEILHATYSERIAALRRNDVVLMFRDMDEAQFAAFHALDVPALMAWCARNPLPPDASFAARNMHSQLAAQDQLVKYFREAARDIRQVLALPGWELDGMRRKAHDDAQVVCRRMHAFLEQLEGTGAFPAEISRAALFEPERMKVLFRLLSDGK